MFASPEAANGLCLCLSSEGLRIEWDGVDWFGPLGHTLGGTTHLVPDSAETFAGEDVHGRFHGTAFLWPGVDSVATTARTYTDAPLIVFRLEALEKLDGLATGRLDTPSVAWPHLHPEARREDELAGDAVAFGHQYTEFALPTFSDASCARFFTLPGRPAVVMPLVLAAGDRALLLGPLDHFHEQIIAVPRGAVPAKAGVRCGWHGDLERVAAGFATEIAVWGASGVRAALDAWGGELRRVYGTPQRSRYADDVVSRLSYWTDNGAAYWYRTESGRSVGDTLGETLDQLRESDVPVHAVELDSWFYPHATLRRFDSPEVDVPPTGMITWEPREDVLPGGMQALHQRMGRPPLILHGRHFSSRSPYFDRFEAWRDGDRAHPKTPDFFESLMEQAAAFGAVCYEQDWMVESFLGVRGLREEPGRAREWQLALDRAADRRSLSLVWCMSTPADLCQTVELSRVSAVRTSGDYRYIVGNASLWCWFLYGNALARSLGLLPFKDVFLSSREGSGLDGDPHAEVEAMLSALSAGPVGIGDRLGRSDRDLVLRTCRADGVLVKPDAPLAAIERCYQGHAHLAGPLVGETFSQQPAGRWLYLAALHANRTDELERFDLALPELGPLAPTGPVVAWDWRERRLQQLEPDAALSYALEPRDWRLHVLCPVLRGEIAIVGDPALYATAGDRRIHSIREADAGLAFDVVGAAGERVELVGWSGRGRPAGRAWAPTGPAPIDVSDDPAGGGAFRLAVEIGSRGWVGVHLDTV